MTYTRWLELAVVVLTTSILPAIIWWGSEQKDYWRQRAQEEVDAWMERHNGPR